MRCSVGWYIGNRQFDELTPSVFKAVFLGCLEDRGKKFIRNFKDYRSIPVFMQDGNFEYELAK